MLGIKQEGLAYELGEEWTQKRVSILEQKDVIEQNILDQVAKILKVPAEAIKNFDEDAAINIITNTFNSHDNSTSIAYKSTFDFNPIEKIVDLYERMLIIEREKNDLLQRLVDIHSKIK